MCIVTQHQGVPEEDEVNKRAALERKIDDFWARC